MGGIKIISPMPKPLSTKAFPKMTGGMERNDTQRVRFQASLDDCEEPRRGVQRLVATW